MYEYPNNRPTEEQEAYLNYAAQIAEDRDQEYLRLEREAGVPSLQDEIEADYLRQPHHR